MNNIKSSHPQNFKFSHQKLVVFQVAKQALALIIQHQDRFRGLTGELGPQLHRAMTSVVLNIGEGAGRWTPADQRRHYQIACGSATEVAVCLEVAELHGVLPSLIEELSAMMARVVAMLMALIRSRR